MDEQSRLFAGVNAPAMVAARFLAAWQGALTVVLSRWASAGLAAPDQWAQEAYAALERGRWLTALLWLSEGPYIDRSGSSDPLGALLAAVVLRASSPLAHAGWWRASPYWRAFEWQHGKALHQRPDNDPMQWAVVALLRCGGRPRDLDAVESALRGTLGEVRVDELVVMHARAWAIEAADFVPVFRREANAGGEE